MSVRCHSILNQSYWFVLIMNKQELFQQHGFRDFHCFQIIIFLGGGTSHRWRGNFFRFWDRILAIPNGWFEGGGKKKRRLRHWDREVRNSFEPVSKQIKAVIIFRGQWRLLLSAPQSVPVDEPRAAKGSLWEYRPGNGWCSQRDQGPPYQQLHESRPGLWWGRCQCPGYLNERSYEIDYRQLTGFSGRRNALPQKLGYSTNYPILESQLTYISQQYKMNVINFWNFTALL